MTLIPKRLRISLLIVGACTGAALRASDVATPSTGTPITPVTPGATSRIAAVRISVAPDHKDWTYHLGDSVRFAVSVTADSEPIEGVVISYTLGPDMYPGPVTKVALPLNGITIDAGTMSKPGFLRCIVTTEVAGHSYRGLATAAFDPASITPTQKEPSDFDAFWNAGMADLATVPMDARITLIPESCTSSVDTYQVSFRTVGGSNSRIYGILCQPRGPGRYPAILEVPGAGVRPYGGDPNLASKGVVVLQIGIHGIPVNLNKEVYDNLGSAALNAYWFYNLDDRDRYYYRRVYLGCIRANDFLTSLANWDGKNLVVVGGSQGGQLTIATTALDHRVTGLAASFPGYCDVTGDLEGRAGGWPRPFAPQPGGSPSLNSTSAKIATTAYFDTVNFARRVGVPGFYNWGFNDEVCPPTAAYAAYNLLRAPKTLVLQLESGHAPPPEQADAVTGWLSQFLNLK